MKKNLVLIGMMGVGKSTIGKFLSKKLKICHFEDLDSKIENKMSSVIKDIFDLKGERYFRKIEENESINLIKEEGKL